MNLATRRQFLLNSGMATAALSLHGVVPFANAEPSSLRFDITQPGKTLFEQKPMISTPDTLYSGFQAFQFDETNRRIFYTMGEYTGVGEGNLIFSWLHDDGSPNSGAYMHLKSFGHGEAFGVETIGRETWIWLETHSFLDNPNASYKVGFGNRIGRFRWDESKGKIFESSDLGTSKWPGSALYELKPGSRTNMCALDVAAGRLLLYYIPVDANHHDLPARLALYNMDDVKEHGDKAVPLQDREMVHIQPAHSPLQGVALYGNYAYLNAGFGKPNTGKDCYSSVCPSTTLYYQNMLTGQSAVADINTAPGLPRREPEGVAIQIVEGKPRLVYGYCGYSSAGQVCGGRQQLYMSLYYIDGRVS